MLQELTVAHKRHENDFFLKVDCYLVRTTYLPFYTRYYLLLSGPDQIIIVPDQIVTGPDCIVTSPDCIISCLDQIVSGLDRLISCPELDNIWSGLDNILSVPDNNLL